MQVVAFVTVGTTKFDELIAAVDSTEVADALAARGYDRLVMQVREASSSFGCSTTSFEGVLTAAEPDPMASTRWRCSWAHQACAHLSGGCWRIQAARAVPAGAAETPARQRAGGGKPDILWSQHGPHLSLLLASSLPRCLSRNVLLAHSAGAPTD